MLLLAGDVGGTKTRLAVYDTARGLHSPLFGQTYASDEYSSLESMSQEFLQNHRLTVQAACVGIAGPVVEGEAVGTNVRWRVRTDALSAALGADAVWVLNDLEALAYAVPDLGAESLATLRAGEPAERGVIAVIAPGTGLGEGFLIWQNGRYRAMPSEGGHADFGPNTSLQVELLAYLRAKLGHVSTERVCSGLGIPNIYRFLRDQGHAKEPEWLATTLMSADDATPVIVNAALDENVSCDICQRTLEMFICILGTEASDLALTVMATGGVYLGGGIPRRILSALRGPVFLKSFDSKGRLAYLLRQLPVHVILDPHAAVFGAAAYGLHRIEEMAR